MFKSDPHEKNRSKMTQSTSSQTSVTPGFASILSSFLLLSAYASALLVQLFASDGCEKEKKKTVTTGVKKTVTVMEEGGYDTDSVALSAHSTCQSITNLSLADVSTGLTQLVAHTPQTHTFIFLLITQSSSQG